MAIGNAPHCHENLPTLGRSSSKATFSECSDAKPGNAIQGYSAEQVVFEPLPADSLISDHSFLYDAKGNRSQYDLAGWTYYPGTDRVKQTADATYVYDANGNLTEKTTTDGVKWTYIYDVRNQLVEVQKTLSGGTPETVATYLYDSEGNRIKSAYPGDGTSVVYQFDLTGLLTENPIMEERSGSTQNFVYLNRQLLARVDGTIGTGTKYWYAVDHLGSNRRMMDGSGNVVWWADYEAFGKVKATEGSVGEVPRFTGKAWDEKVGLYYFNARWYEPEIGKFMGEDPAPIDAKDPLTANLTIYCRSNPLIFLDPSGATIVYYTYNRQAAVSYARDHTYDPHMTPPDTGAHNPDYIYFDRGNCTNFVSQCLHEGGGLPMTRGWYYEGLSRSPLGTTYIDYTHSWAAVSDFHAYLEKSGWLAKETSCLGSVFRESPREFEEATKGLQIGDVIQIADCSGHMFHTMVVTAVDPIRVTYNSKDTQDEPLEDIMQRNSNSTFYFMMINDQIAVESSELYDENPKLWIPGLTGPFSCIPGEEVTAYADQYAQKLAEVLAAYANWNPRGHSDTGRHIFNWGSNPYPGSVKLGKMSCGGR